MQLYGYTISCWIMRVYDYNWLYRYIPFDVSSSNSSSSKSHTWLSWKLRWNNSCIYPYAPTFSPIKLRHIQRRLCIWHAAVEVIFPIFSGVLINSKSLRIGSSFLTSTDCHHRHSPCPQLLQTLFINTATLTALIQWLLTYFRLS